MKMFFYTLFAVVPILGVLSSCNQPPETFEQAMKKYNEKQFEASIDLFKLTSKEEEEWYDSSLVMIDHAVDSVFSITELGKIAALCRSHESDSIVRPYLNRHIKLFWNKNMEANPLLTFNMFDSLRFMLKGLSGVDTLMRKNEDAFFHGIWKCNKGSVKGNEIYFERDKDSKLFNGKSNKSRNGWDLGKTIYKDIYYIGNNELDHRVRVFSSTWWGYTTEYFTKTKGKMTIRSNDTLLIDYEGSVNSSNRVFFVRENKKDV
jgi:hypothetical protein